MDLAAKERSGRMVTLQNRRVVHVLIEDAIERHQTVDPDDMLVHTARGLGIFFGDEQCEV